MQTSERLLEPSLRRRSSTVRWLAAAAAAAATAGLIVGVTVAGDTAGQRLSSQLPAGAPKYYVTLDATPRAGGAYLLRAVVRGSATGAPISSVRLLRSRGFPYPFAIVGAANDRDFLITLPAPGGADILRLAANGHVLGLSRVPSKILDLGGGYRELTPIALSPDGTDVVVPIYPSGPCPSCAHGIAMYSMTTGVTRKWLLASGDDNLVAPVNWPGNGHDVFLSVGLLAYRLLDVARPGGSLVASSRAIRGPGSPRGWVRYGSWLLPDELALFSPYVWMSAHGATARILETSASTGTVLRVLYVAHVPYTGAGVAACYPESLGPSQLDALMWCLNRFGRLDGSQFTPLPGGSKGITYGAAW